MASTVPIINGLTQAAKDRIKKENEKDVDDRPVFVVFHEDFTAMDPDFPKSKMLEFKKSDEPQPVPHTLISEIINKVDARIIANKPLENKNVEITDSETENQGDSNSDKTSLNESSLSADEDAVNTVETSGANDEQSELGSTD